MLCSIIAAASVAYCQTPFRPKFSVDWTTKQPYYSTPTPDVSPMEKGQTCEPVHVQLLGRHGSRFGDHDDADLLLESLQTKKDAIRNPAFEFLKSWTDPFPQNMDKQLTEGGKKEWYDIGRRFVKRFKGTPVLTKYNPEFYPVDITWKSRTGRSASSFLLPVFQERQGSLGWLHSEPIHMRTIWNGIEDDEDGNYLLQFYKNCPRYTAEVDDNDAHPANSEKEKFIADNFGEILERVSQKLDLDASIWQLTLDEAEAMYKICMMQTVALDVPMDHPTSLCRLFEERDFELYAFEKDLGEYYESGPGADLSMEVSCPLVASMMQGLKAAKDGQSPVKARFYFAHSATVAPVIAYLGLFHDEKPLTADMPWADALARQWRTGRLLTMSVNIQMVLHKCTDGEGNVSWKAELRHSERHMNWPRCGNETNVPFCDPDVLLQGYPLATTCDFGAMCAVP